jgi:hypothetical protein
MKKLIYVFIVLTCFINCTSVKTESTKNTQKKDQPVRIANDELEYEIIIFDSGFETYLQSISKPMNHYTESFLESRNRDYVITWNMRARNPLQYNSNIYENVIDYDPNIHYGLEVNYKLYNYFKFVEQKYQQQF